MAGCATVHVAPFSAAPDRSRLTPDQKVVWQASDEQDTAFQNIGADYDDPQLTQYVQGVVNRLYPDFHGVIRVHLLKSTVPNAFMMANGSCYVQLGLLPLLQDESGLAMVLSHEGIHFVNQHGVEERTQEGNAVTAALILGVTVPIIGPALAVSSIYGYSVDMENEADRVGYQRYLKAGYPADAAVQPFLALDGYTQAMGIKESYFYADHPKLQNRIAYFKAQAIGAPAGGDSGGAHYLATSLNARLWVLQELLSRQDQKTLIFLLEDPARLADYPDYAAFYLGAAYALRNGDGDGAHAERLYRQVVAKDPDFAPSYAALGKMLMRRNDNAEAAKMFEDYLKLAPNSADRAYIEADLKQLSAAAPVGAPGKGR